MPEVWTLQTHKTSWRQNKVQCTSEYFTFNEKMKKKYWNLKTCVLLTSERKLIIFYSIYLKTLGKCYCLVILNTILSYIYYILYIFQHVNRTIIFQDFRVTGHDRYQKTTEMLQFQHSQGIKATTFMFLRHWDANPGHCAFLAHVLPVIYTLRLFGVRVVLLLWFSVCLPFVFEGGRLLLGFVSKQDLV